MAGKVSGLDLSITAPGVAYTGDDGTVRTALIKPREKGDLRLNEIAGEIVRLVDDSDLVLVEGYLNHSMTAGITGMVHGAVRAALIEQGLRYGTFPPSSLKKYATGRGGASKTDMAVAAFKRGGVEFTNDNECDAWWLWVAARERAGDPVFDLPKTQSEALEKIRMEAT
jgi:Holliday junction resolvasome RuvABC endonuclease subunit